MISLLYAQSQSCRGILQFLKFLNFTRENSIQQTITMIQFRCNEGMSIALSIRLRKIFSDCANKMKRTRKSATDVADMRNKGLNQA